MRPKQTIFKTKLFLQGFLSLEDPSLNIPGNAGLKDQTMALRWIKNNVQNFGGDLDNITIFGESAGGGAVHFHTISDYSKGLFHKAIPMSGCALNKTWTCIPRRDWAKRLAIKLGWNGNGGEKEILEFLEDSDPCEVADACDNLLTDEVKQI